MDHQRPVTSVAFRPDGAELATASEDGTVRVVDAETGQLRLELRHPRGVVRSVTFSPDGRQIVSTGGVDHQSGDVLVWDTQDGRRVALLRGHTDIVYA